MNDFRGKLDFSLYIGARSTTGYFWVISNRGVRREDATAAVWKPGCQGLVLCQGLGTLTGDRAAWANSRLGCLCFPAVTLDHWRGQAHSGWQLCWHQTLGGRGLVSRAHPCRPPGALALGVFSVICWVLGILVVRHRELAHPAGRQAPCLSTA